MSVTFTRAQRKQARLRLAITGPSGSGKTYSALMLAKGIGGRVAVIDTEHGSASLYDDLIEFDTLEMEAPFAPERYIEAIEAAEAAGYDVLIIDSITHEWNGKGGVLEIHDKVTRASRSGNSYNAWAEVTPRHNAFIESMLQSKLHLIVTMRSKQDFVLTEGKNGKQVPKKVGLAPVQRDGLEYEFTVVMDCSIDGNFATASKDRTRLFHGRDPAPLTQADGVKLRDWLHSGVDTEAAIEADVAALKEVLSAAARQGKTAFVTAWQGQRGPVRDRVGSDEVFMAQLNRLCTEADAQAPPPPAGPDAGDGHDDEIALQNDLGEDVL